MPDASYLRFPKIWGELRAEEASKLLLFRCGESSARLAAVVNGALHLFAVAVDFSSVVDLGA